jgi:hypothetical protein
MGEPLHELLVRRPAWRAITLTLFAALACGGCSAAKQDYAVIARDSPAADLDDSRVVAEGILHIVRVRPPPLRLRDYLYGWLLPIGGPPADRIDADLGVERVLRGDVGSTPVELRHLRFETADELKRFPDVYAFHNRLRIRIGYDRREGDRYVALKLVPLDSGPTFDELGRVRARPTGTEPSTAPSK